MARQNKKTRIKGLPPKIQLQTKDSHTGSYPSRVRLASDNRTGKYSIFWNDTNALIFTSSANNVNLGTGLPNNFLQKDFYQDLGADMSSSINSSGSIIKGVADNQFLFTPGQALEPFKENAHVEQGNFSSFYLTGSPVRIAGEGFTSKLASKTKIIIDLTSRTECSFSLQNFNSSSNNFPMAYWNHVAKTWQGIGTGKEFAHADYHFPPNGNEEQVRGAYKKFFDEQTIGFGRGINLMSNEERLFNSQIEDKLPQSFGLPISNFGFPNHVKYAATSSNYIEMKNYINKPFLLEKIVLKISCSFEQNRTYGQWGSHSDNGPYRELDTASGFLSTFFILNQTKNNKYFLKNTQNVYSMSSDIGVANIVQIPSGNINSVRDLITWGQIYSCETTPTHLLTSGVVTFGSGGSYPDAREYFDGFGNPLYDTYISNENLSDRMATDILIAKDKEYVIGSDHPFLYTLDLGDYRQAHPEFNTITGSNPSAVGQESFGNETYMGWSGEIKLDILPKAPLKRDNTTFGFTFGYKDTILPTHPVGNIGQIYHGFVYTNKVQGRRFNNKPTGRDVKNTLLDAGFPPIDTGNSGSVRFGSSTNGITVELFSYNENQQINPYILLPSDNLIFGWQLPISAQLVWSQIETLFFVNKCSFQNLGPKMSFAPVPGSITLYGSYIKEGKEHHDTLNQLLTSESVHEIIGEE